MFLLLKVFLIFLIILVLGPIQYILVKTKLSKKFSSNNSTLITRERHRVKLNECLKEIDKFLKKDSTKDLELAAEDLRMATRHLGNIVGKVDVEEILGSIFKDFCIGK